MDVLTAVGLFFGFLIIQLIAGALLWLKNRRDHGVAYNEMQAEYSAKLVINALSDH